MFSPLRGRAWGSAEHKAPRSSLGLLGAVAIQAATVFVFPSTQTLFHGSVLCSSASPLALLPCGQNPLLPAIALAVHLIQLPLQNDPECGFSVCVSGPIIHCGAFSPQAARLQKGCAERFLQSQGDFPLKVLPAGWCPCVPANPAGIKQPFPGDLLSPGDCIASECTTRAFTGPLHRLPRLLPLCTSLEQLGLGLYPCGERSRVRILVTSSAFPPFLVQGNSPPWERRKLNPQFMAILLKTPAVAEHSDCCKEHPLGASPCLLTG